MPVTSQSQLQWVSHWLLSANHKPHTNPTGVTPSGNCQSQANHKFSECHTGYEMPITIQPQTQRVSHWVLNVNHKPATNPMGVTMGTKCKLGVTLGTHLYSPHKKVGGYLSRCSN